MTRQVVIDEGERQMILLALEMLRRRRPGFDYALGQIEAKLGGQFPWPETFHDDPPCAASAPLPGFERQRAATGPAGPEEAES